MIALRLLSTSFLLTSFLWSYDKQYGDIRISVEFPCYVNLNSLDEFDMMIMKNIGSKPRYILEMPHFKTYSIERIEFNSLNLGINFFNDEGNLDGKLINDHKYLLYNSTITFDDTRKIFSSYSQDVEIYMRTIYRLRYNVNYFVKNVKYDRNSFLKAEKDYENCMQLIKKKEELLEKPSNRLKKFFGFN